MDTLTDEQIKIRGYAEDHNARAKEQLSNVLNSSTEATAEEILNEVTK